MGQKVNPNGIRLGITTDFSSRWYANKHNFAKYIEDDHKVRIFLKKAFYNAGVSNIRIERLSKTAQIIVSVARPGVISSKKSKDFDIAKQKAEEIMGVPINLSIVSVEKPELDARLVAESIAQQLERRVSFRRAMKRAVQSTLKAGAEGVKLCVSGRLGGAEIARTEWYREGRVPLHTFRAYIDYGFSEAKTTYGIIGVKVWISKGEKISRAN